MRRKAKTPEAKLKDKCDRTLTPILKKEKPRCEACNQLTEVAHHWKEKACSNRLRYDFDNLIALCHSCHSKIHNKYGASITGCLDVADKIRKKKGKRWENRIKKKAYEYQKMDVIYLEKKLKYLQNRLTKVK